MKSVHSRVLRIVYAISPLIWVYLASQVGYYAGWFDAWYPMSPIFHTAGGVAVAMAAYRYVYWPKDPLFCLDDIPIFFQIMMMIALAGVFGLLWEWYEYLSDLWLHTAHILSLLDTLLDLSMDLFGALVYSILRISVDKKKKI